MAKACVFIDAPCKVKEKQKKEGLYIIVFEEILKEERKKVSGSRLCLSSGAE